MALYELRDGEGALVNTITAMPDRIAAIAAKKGLTATLIDDSDAVLRRALNAERKAMEAWRLAFRSALLMLLAAPGVTLYAAVETAVAAARAVDPTDPLVLGWDNITIFQRWSPDVETFRATFNMTEVQVDTIFRVAMAVERDDMASATDLATLWNGAFE